MPYVYGVWHEGDSIECSTCNDIIEAARISLEYTGSLLNTLNYFEESNITKKNTEEVLEKNII